MTAAPKMARSLIAEDERVIFKLFIELDLLERAGVCRVTADVAKLDYGIDADGDSGNVFPYLLPPNGKPACRVTARLPRQSPEGCGK
jgi:hypothetical protein